ncbi:MAG: sugar kinase [Spirochaetia bacterium]|nr:sugar kinase [Spirochaetia bacterium]
MADRPDNKTVIIKRPTRVDDLINRFNTVSQARFYVEHLGADFNDYLGEHKTYYASLESAAAAAQQCGIVQIVDRKFLPNFIFGPRDTVVAVGQDGLVANTLKYLSGQPLIGVNPDAERWDGVLLPFSPSDLHSIIPEVQKGGRKRMEISMVKAELNDGQSILAVNDLFIGQKTHVSARYSIMVGDASESQSSSGIIISTGLGSSGWLKSIIAGSAGIEKYLGASVPDRVSVPAGWDSDSFVYTVREPFPSNTTSAKLVFGEVKKGCGFSVVSMMAENGVIFSDGIENDFLEFNSGTKAVVTIAEKKGVLVV